MRTQTHPRKRARARTRLCLRSYKTCPSLVQDLSFACTRHCQREYVSQLSVRINQKKLASTSRSQCKFLVLKSGRLDSNQRPRAPQTCTLTGLSYAPNLLGIMALRRTFSRRSSFLSFLASAKLLNSYVPAKCFAHFFCVGGGIGSQVGLVGARCRAMYALAALPWAAHVRRNIWITNS